MKSLTKEKRYDLIDAFNSTSRYLDDLLYIWFTEYILLNFINTLKQKLNGTKTYEETTIDEKFFCFVLIVV